MTGIDIDKDGWGSDSAIIMAMNVVIDMLFGIINTMRIKTMEKRRRHAAGFTMAEMLIVIAIIGVLSAVSFIAVQTHQKSMTQLQYDTIAKEIFVAAQNHLTLAKSENYRQVSDLSTALNKTTASGAYFFGSDGDAPADGAIADIRYFYSGKDNSSTALEQILPFGAVELVTGGKYIIRYQPIAARVLDVFYWTDGDSRYDAELDERDYSTLVGDESNTDKHVNYTGSGLLGWCGGEGIVETGVILHAPEIKVDNKEMLLVTVTDVKGTVVNSDTTVESKLKLIVTGNSSGAKVAIPLVSNTGTDRVKYTKDINRGDIYTVILDDITAEKLHFSKLRDKDTEKMPSGTLYNDKYFVPGENITIQAVAYSDKELASVAYSGEWTTNSLFGEVSENTTTSGSVTTTTAETVKISNIRHLANLNDSLSDVDYDDNYFGSAVSAVQTVDLDWNAFKTGINGLKERDADAEISIYDKKEASTKVDCFLPVTLSDTYTLNYDGQYEVEIAQSGEDGTPAEPIKIKENHSIKGIVVDNTGDAPGTATVTTGGVFGSLKGGEIKNLALIDTNVTLASGDVGALAGSLNGTKVENVIAYNSTDTTTANITTASGSAGGLVGSVTGEVKLSKSAAALIVSSAAGNAGGLIGTADGGTITGCYSGGHTIEKKNGTGVDAEVIGVIYGSDNYNVTAGAYAGGLIGDAGAAKIESSYSTCSAKGKNAGGFVGKASGAISNSYCTGLVGVTVGSDGKPVSGTSAGAFAAVCTGTTTSCSYFEIVNEFEDATLGFDYLTALPKDDTGDGSKDGVTALDADVTAYNNNTGVWSNAEPYLKASLMKYYGEGTGDARVPKYNLKGIGQLGVTLQPEVKDSNGNVTTPADFVVTHYGDWPAPEIFVVNTK